MAARALKAEAGVPSLANARLPFHLLLRPVLQGPHRRSQFQRLSPPFLMPASSDLRSAFHLRKVWDAAGVILLPSPDPMDSESEPVALRALPIAPSVLASARGVDSRW